MSLGPVMLDIEGKSLTPADRDLLLEPAVGGVILFARNYESPKQLADLVSEIRALRTPGLIIAADHEGGRVQRFQEGFTRIPPMRYVGHEYERSLEAGLELAQNAGWLIAAELRAVGIDLCFAPCVDLDRGLSQVIGDRSFHRVPAVVGELAVAFCRGLRSAGMAAVAKHFPGHGGVVGDSHEQLPVDRRQYRDILDDIEPYEKLLSNGLLAGIMTAHIVYPELDPLPAGFSGFWIEQELRSRLGFGGAVFSDDLSMSATSSYGTMPTRARRALEAGCDMILVCNDRTAAKQVVDSLSDFSSPVSLVRLARLHGTGQFKLEALRASQRWQEASASVRHWGDRPQLELDA